MSPRVDRYRCPRCKKWVKDRTKNKKVMRHKCLKGGEL